MICAIVSRITPNLSQLGRESRTATVCLFILGTGPKRAYNGPSGLHQERTITTPGTNSLEGRVACHSNGRGTLFALIAASFCVATTCSPADSGKTVDARFWESRGLDSRPSAPDSLDDGSRVHDLGAIELLDAHETALFDQTQGAEIILLNDAIHDVEFGPGTDLPDLAIADEIVPLDSSLTDLVAPSDANDVVAPDLFPGELKAEDGKEVCPHTVGVCIGLTYYWCDADSGSALSTSCVQPPESCLAATCIDEVGCKILPTFGNPCEDGDPCTLGDTCAEGVCQPGTTMTCDDGNPCTIDGPCQEGECQPGAKVDCDDDNPCTDDSCNPDGSGCMHTPNSNECGPNMVCADSLCTTLPYPAPPYGTFQGDTMANHVFIDPDDLSERFMEEFYGDGKVLLITFNAGWCKVCKEDTVLLNNWLAEHEEAGLRILSILYETPNATPINQGYAQWWDEYYSLTFPLWMDTPTADAQGEATGGVLETYRKPSGPVSQGYFPVTIIVCPATMEILYVDKGFYDEIIEEIVNHWLFLGECG